MGLTINVSRQKREDEKLCKTETGTFPIARGRNGNPDPGKKCVFPFKYNGKTYQGCPPDNFVKDKRWCSTATDENGNHIIGDNKFGICEDKCPAHVVKGKV